MRRFELFDTGMRGLQIGQSERAGHWVEGKFGYALSGELERDALLKVAQEVYRELG